MVEFTFPSQRHGWINGVRGTVTGIRKWTGATPASKVAGSANAKVDERAKVEIWISNSKGKDVQIPFDVPAVEGNEVTVLWGNLLGKDKGTYLFWANHSTGKHGVIEEHVEASFLMTETEIRLGVFLFVVLWALLFLEFRHYPHGFLVFGKSIFFLLSAFLGWVPGLLIWLMVGPSRRKRIGEMEQGFLALTERQNIGFEG